MGCEKKGFRDNIARFNELFPDKELLNTSDVMKLTGWGFRRVRRSIKFNQFGGITKADLSRQLSV